MTLGSVCHHLANLLVGVVVAIGKIMILTGEQTLDLAIAIGTDSGQLGTALHLDAPALIVGQVPMEVVELMQRHKVDIALDVIHGEEVAHHIEQQTTILEAGIVLNLDLGQTGQNACLRGQ